MIDLREIRSVTEFQRNNREYTGRLKKSKSPLVLTVNGRAETLAAIKRGMDQFERGEAIPLDQAEEKLRAKHGSSR